MKNQKRSLAEAKANFIESVRQLNPDEIVKSHPIASVALSAAAGAAFSHITGSGLFKFANLGKAVSIVNGLAGKK